LLLERLPPTEKFMKNFAVEVLRYLLSPFFDDNDELLGIEIIDFSFLTLFFLLLLCSLFSFILFLFLHFLRRISCLLFRIQWTWRNHNLGAFIWKPNNLFRSSPSVGERFLSGKGMFLRTPRVGAADTCGCKWSWSWEHDHLLDKGLTRVD
jgi:hypothetical protein